MSKYYFVGIKGSGMSSLAQVLHDLGNEVIGYDDNTNILEVIRNKPYSVLILDEIERAHNNIINLFFTIHFLSLFSI